MRNTRQGVQAQDGDDVPSLKLIMETVSVRPI